MNQLFTVKGLAEYAQVHPSTVYKLVESGEISFIRKRGVGIRFQKEDVDQWLERGKVLHEPVILRRSMAMNFPAESVRIGAKGGTRESMSRKARHNYGFGTVYFRKTKQGNDRWCIDYRRNGERIREMIPEATCREEALYVLRKRITELFDTRHRPKRTPTFRSWADEYLTEYAKPRKLSWKTDRAYIEANMKPFFKDVLISEITPIDIRKYIKLRLESGVSSTTVNRCLQILRKMFNLAIDCKLLETNPIKKGTLFSEKGNTKDRILTYEEEGRLLENCTEHLKPIVIIALSTGLRRGEILSLKWSDIDFQGKAMKVEREKGGSIPFIFLTESVTRQLAMLKAKAGKAEHVFVNPKSGKPFVEIGKAFRAACRRAGIKGLRFHDLRHTFASRLIEKGVDIVTVRDLLGHSSVKLTERYTHSRNESRRRAIELLEPKSAEEWTHDRHTEKWSVLPTPVVSLFSVN